MAQLQHKFVTELPQAECVLPNDYLLISQKDDRETIPKSERDTEIMSRKLRYETLCATVIADIDGKISSSVSAAISALELSTLVHESQISALSSGLAETTSAVIKIANCVQKNKFDISAICADVSSLQGVNMSGTAGISVQLTGTYGWEIGHTSHIPSKTVSFVKVGYDQYGHVSASQNVVSSDIAKLANFIAGVGSGLSTGDNVVRLKIAASDEIGGVKIDGQNLAIGADGKLSAKDTVYSAGAGVGLDGNEFSLLCADSDSIGGVIVGANLSAVGGRLSAIYRLASDEEPGVVKTGFVDLPEENQYGLRILTDGKAYVTVPTTVPTFLSDTLMLPVGQTLCAISQANGNVTGISGSYVLYDMISAISANQQEISGISACVTTKNASLEYVIKTGSLTLFGGDDMAEAADTNIPVIISGEATTSAYAYDDDGESVLSVGYYLKLAKNTDEQPADSIYVDIGALSGMIRLPEEEWTFTLDDGSSVSVMVTARPKPVFAAKSRRRK